MTLWRIRATVDDRPGYLSVLTASLALRGVNILSVQVHTTESGAVDDFLVDAPPGLSTADLVEAVHRGRGRDCWVAPSESRGLVDQPTRALGLAARVAAEPDALGEALRSLLGATAVTWQPRPDRDAAGGGPARFFPDRMLLADPTGGVYQVARDEPVFTPAEYARAQALVDVAATVARRDADQVRLVLADGAEVLLRPATPADLPAVRRMHRRCAAASRRGRYLGDRPPSLARLARLLDPSRGLALVAVAGDPPGTVVALAHLVVEGDLAEAGLLVEDRWQRRGLGRAVLRRLAGRARRAGCAALVGHTRADNVAALRLLSGFEPDTRTEPDGALATVTVPLATRRRAGAADSGYAAVGR